MAALDLNIQRQTTKMILDVISVYGFALAGSGAIREHGLINRQTQDIDLFTSFDKAEEGCFEDILKDIEKLFKESNYSYNKIRNESHFARYRLEKDGQEIELDIGIDYRKNEPVILDIGPVLDVEDAVMNKLTALYSRGEFRDFLDVYSILESKKYSFEELLVKAKEYDLGFTEEYFAMRLKEVSKINLDNVSEYGINESQLTAIKARLTKWADEILNKNEDYTKNELSIGRPPKTKSRSEIISTNRKKYPPSTEIDNSRNIHRGYEER